MSTEANRGTVHRFVDEVLAGGDANAIDALVTPDFVSHTWGITENGPASLRAATERIHGSLKDVEFTIDDEVADGDTVVVRLTSSATPTGEFMGAPASGRGYTIGEIHWFRLSDGRIAEHWHQHDGLGLMKQLQAEA
jgi:predicted ester cyclase